MGETPGGPPGAGPAARPAWGSEGSGFECHSSCLGGLPAGISAVYSPLDSLPTPLCVTMFMFPHSAAPAPPREAGSEGSKQRRTRQGDSVGVGMRMSWRGARGDLGGTGGSGLCEVRSPRLEADIRA